MTTKLIQELVGLCVEKGVRFEFDIYDGFKLTFNSQSKNTSAWYTKKEYLHASVDGEDAPEQLQAAIDKVELL